MFVFLFVHINFLRFPSSLQNRSSPAPPPFECVCSMSWDTNLKRYFNGKNILSRLDIILLKTANFFPWVPLKEHFLHLMATKFAREKIVWQSTHRISLLSKSFLLSPSLFAHPRTTEINKSFAMKCAPKWCCLSCLSLKDKISLSTLLTLLIVGQHSLPRACSIQFASRLAQKIPRLAKGEQLVFTITKN